MSENCLVPREFTDFRTGEYGHHTNPVVVAVWLMRKAGSPISPAGLIELTRAANYCDGIITGEDES